LERDSLRVRLECFFFSFFFLDGNEDPPGAGNLFTAIANMDARRLFGGKSTLCWFMRQNHQHFTVLRGR
jgi:hypothetical protein